MRGLLAVFGAGLVVSGCAGAAGDRPASAPLTAGAALRNKDGQQVGAATLIETPDGVRIAVTGYRLPPGPKGLHVHTVGQCEPPEFTTSGDHFNPGNRKHGLKNPDGPHAGDLPSLNVTAAGEGGIDYLNKLVTLRSGRPDSLVDGRGTAVIIHAGPDDDMTDPAGNSGARIACGVIIRD
jgi:superoxide dismutase, Cu-Zn family